ncbi:hypothetical protein ACYFX5_09280 [Bremerella sp. T1]|uniref:hypothetical protein n=1 Tax=Bremerella sp. TYQ1 TaxID=3119568 RepID=UPI001CCA252B|nr:hypothetical protein [Bremerella volcania]UBM38444.1 hypothetical protein LA756_11220 [Bremerella volcania]
MQKQSILLSLKALSNALGTRDFPEANDACPIQSIRSLRSALHHQRESDRLPMEPSELVGDKNEQFVQLILVKIESLLTIQRPLTFNELVTASSAISTLAKQLLPREEEATLFAVTEKQVPDCAF